MPIKCFNLIKSSLWQIFLWIANLFSPKLFIAPAWTISQLNNIDVLGFPYIICGGWNKNGVVVWLSGHIVNNGPLL